MVTATGLILATALAMQPGNENAGINLPEGFSAAVAHEGVGSARHMAIRDNGDIYVALQRPNNGAGIACLRDADKDGTYETTEYFGELRGTGIALRGEWLYFGEDFRIVRYRLPADSLVPVGEPEVIVEGFVRDGQHAAKPIDFGDDGRLYVNVGAPSNACQTNDRTPGSPGMDPCPILEYAGGIWSYDADTPNQNHPQDGERFATGLRNCVAIDAHAGAVYTVVHGRDQLDSLYPNLYDSAANAELPAEEMHRLTKGTDAGWPFTYYDGLRGERVVAPEYGGDGKTIAEAGKFADPIQAFPAHWAPNGILIYEGSQFPDRYRGGAFVAFHGSWNRAPEVQAGYNVTFTPFADGLPSAEFEIFADGFAGTDTVRSPRDAKHRPMGLATGPDGALYISDSVKGRIWRITFTGNAE